MIIPESEKDKEYIVANIDKNGVYFYGAYNNKETAKRVADEIDGIVFAKINTIYYNKIRETKEYRKEW